MPPTLHYIAHTHWEGAVFKTREEYLQIGLPNILLALRLLEHDPDYRFTLDQMCYVEPFLTRYPEEAERFRRFVAEGRLAIVGGTHVMHDGNMPGPESYVRQIAHAKQWFRRVLGVDVTIGWQLDTFGHHAQTPQILRQAGYGSIWFFRGVPSAETPAEFWWEALDGTRIPAYWLPHSYAVGYGSPQSPDEFAAFIQQRYAMLDAFCRHDERPAPAGADVCEPEPHVAELARQMNAAGRTPRVLISVPQDYERAVPPDDDWKVVRGEMNPIFQGAYSSRIELKQATREIEAALTDAEALGAVLTAEGVGGCADDLWDAWEPMLFNQAHDLMSGVMTDHVYEDTLASYARSRRLASEALDRRARAYAARADTQGEGIPVVVINALAWERSDLVNVRVGFGCSGIKGVRVTTETGEDVPVQIADASRGPDGGLVTASLAFFARSVPALGHRVFRVHGIPDETPQPAAELISGGCSLNNGILRADFDASGALVGLQSLADGRNVLAGPSNVIAQERDEGDLWEPYRPLDGGSRIAMKERHPLAADATFSNGRRPDRIEALHGPVYSEIRIEGGLGEGSYRIVARLVEGCGTLNIRTEVLNRQRFVRYRAAFVTSIHDPARWDEIPFGAMERPEGIEFPAQNWTDRSDGSAGLALLTRGLPGVNHLDNAILLSLLRSTCIVAYGFGGGYEPGMSSDSGFQIGKRIAFEYALHPHKGDWRDADLPRRGVEMNHPLIAVKAEPHSGTFGAQRGLMGPLPEGLVVTSVRPAPKGDIIVRLYESRGCDVADAPLSMDRPIAEAWSVNLLDEAPVSLPIEGGSVRLSVRPFEIKTIRLRMRQP